MNLNINLILIIKQYHLNHISYHHREINKHNLRHPSINIIMSISYYNNYIHVSSLQQLAFMGLLHVHRVTQHNI